MSHTRWLMSLIMSLFIIGSITAQDTISNQPLILLKVSDQYDMGVGDLWEWAGGVSLRQKTQWGYNEDLRLSPLNNEVAYHSWARLWVDHIQANGMTSGGRFPGNIWVITTENTDLGTRVGDQPAEAAVLPQGVADNTLVRGKPIWSPDGTQIAWTERREHAGQAPDANRLVIYDKETQTTRTLVETLPEQYGIDTGIEGHWIGNKIVIMYDTQIPTGPVNFDTTFFSYDTTTGEERFAMSGAFFIEGNNVRPDLTMPVEYMGKTWLGVLKLFPDKFGEWHLIDVHTAEVIVPHESPSAVAAGLSDTSIRVGVHVASQPNNVLYTVTRRDGRQLELGLSEDEFVRSFALSPEGDAIAYQIYNRAEDSFEETVYVWHDGVVTEVPETDDPHFVSEFVWGATTWMIEFSALGQ